MKMVMKPIKVTRDKKRKTTIVAFELNSNKTKNNKRIKK